MSRTLEELRQSSFHQELGRKMYAAFMAQQQGVTAGTALKRIPDHVGDVWLIVADFAEQAVGKAIDLQFPSQDSPKSSELLM
jgi:hypothetical protein